MSHKDFTKLDRLIGKTTALALFCMGTVYLVITSIGFLSLKSDLDPIGDPYFSIMEILILVMAPLMVVLMVEVHAYASYNVKTLSLIALIFMSIVACITCSVHYLRLTASHESITSLPWLFSFTWPSVIYALDILAWDFFFSLSMLFAAPVFKGDRLKASVRIIMIVSGVLSFAGLLGPIVGNMQIRNIGIVGYGVVFPFFCLLLAKVFSRTELLYEEAMQNNE
ncbi:MAG: hypothetical protein M0T74_05515 [Desulfitobacterium hafniense]|nr:hypothetical protein [Desulfitobacterium hafniense]